MSRQDLSGGDSTSLTDSSEIRSEPVNRQAWDRLAERGAPLASPATDQDFRDPLRTVDGAGWLGQSIKGWRVLCLAAGGGRQGPLYAAAGALVTVVDISPSMLQLDRQVAESRRLSLRTIEASMDNLTGLADRCFDAVIHPVSTCYVRRTQPVFAEVARLLRSGGLYISQHKTPQNMQATMSVGADGHYGFRHPYYTEHPVPYPSETNSAAQRLREPGAIEYLHRWEEIVGGICRAGFVIEDLVEPVHAKPHTTSGEFAHRAQFVAPYVRIKARRIGTTSTEINKLSIVW